MINKVCLFNSVLLHSEIKKRDSSKIVFDVCACVFCSMFVDLTSEKVYLLCMRRVLKCAFAYD